MNCEQCGQPCVIYEPWYKPPENHYYKCRKCDWKFYLYEPEGDETND